MINYELCAKLEKCLPHPKSHPPFTTKLSNRMQNFHLELNGSALQ